MKGVFLVSAFASAILIAEGSAFANPCDETLSPSPTSGPDGYVERAGGERCEGMYVSPVSGTPVELVSLTRGQLSYDAAHAIVVRVSLDAAPSNGGAHLRAVGIPDGLYYQMDADLVGNRAIGWPVGDVLLRRRITPDQVGIYAFRKDSSAESVFLPVDVAPAGSAASHEQPIVAVLRVIDVTDLKCRFVPKGQGVLPSYSSVPVSGDRADFVLPPGSGPVAGTLEVRWADPSSGQNRTRTFLIGN